MSQHLETRVVKLEDSISDVSKAINKMEMILQSQQKESERHHKEMEKILDSHTSFTKFMQLTNFKLEQLKEDNQLGYVKEKIVKLNEKLELNTTKGCAALKLAISEDEVSKNDLRHLTEKVGKINDNLTWLWRVVLGSVVVAAVKVFVI
jgi:uncharacterized coiled-coil protein SlyX